MRALIVEDDEVSISILSSLLEDYFTCDIARDGNEGLDKFIAASSGEGYDFIFLDIMMPHKDGQTLLNDIRSYENDKGLEKAKIIMTTALSDFDNVVKSFEYKCDDYIAKPIDKLKVKNILERNGYKKV
ncbi:MAG TPA: response regulator [Thermotogota bacterium]|nr:response regulator [Thermotogota bacterium]HPR97032.1 response regulator [Thermotogota bacterium]